MIDNPVTGRAVTRGTCCMSVQGTACRLGRRIRVGVCTGKSFFDQHLVHVSPFADYIAEQSTVFSTLSSHHLDLGPYGTKLTNPLGGSFSTGKYLIDGHGPEACLFFAPSSGVVIEPGFGRIDPDHANHNFFLGLSTQDGGRVSVFPKLYGAILGRLSFLKLLKAGDVAGTRRGTRRKESYYHGQ